MFRNFYFDNFVYLLQIFSRFSFYVNVVTIKRGEGGRKKKERGETFGRISVQMRTAKIKKKRQKLSLRNNKIRLFLFDISVNLETKLKKRCTRMEY